MKLNFFGAIVGLGVMSMGLGACAADSGEEAVSDTSANLSDVASVTTTHACSGGNFHCLAQVVTSRTSSSGITMMVSHGSPTGMGATDIESAYDLDTTAGTGVTVAIIDAYGYKKAESDLAAYRKQYGLPACTVASGCLKIVNQEGATSPLPKNPPSGDDWTMETALDLDMVSAACPKCNILLIQADDDQGDGLFLAQQTAATAGAAVVSNSWGQSESSTNKGSDSEHYFSNMGSTGVFVAAGDSGYDNGGQGSDYPSTSAFVTGVGGTNLKKASNARGWTETAWSEGGSSCSISIAKPSFQSSITTGCTFRAASDVAALGDPQTGPSVYNNGQWETVGGTSAASPLVAAVFAAAGHGGDGPAFSYSHTTDFNDITSGKNGTCTSALCKAGKGWDGPTGNGSPDGKKIAGSHKKS